MDNKELNWEEVVNFFSKKYILTRASFINSSAQIEGDKLNVHLGSKGRFLLLQKNIDKTVSDFIFNTTGKRLEINFIEPDNSDFIAQRDNAQDSIIKEMIEANEKRIKEVELKKNQEEINKKVRKAKSKIENAIGDSITNKSNLNNDVELSSRRGYKSICWTIK